MPAPQTRTESKEARTVRENIRECRQERGWTQMDLSRNLTAAGFAVFHPTTVVRIEAGERALKIDEAIQIARVLEVPLERLTQHQSESTITDALGMLIRKMDGSIDDLIQAVESYLDTRSTLYALAGHFDYSHATERARAAQEKAFEELQSSGSFADLIGAILVSVGEEYNRFNLPQEVYLGEFHRPEGQFPKITPGYVGKVLNQTGTERGFIDLGEHFGQPHPRTIAHQNGDD